MKGTFLHPYYSINITLDAKAHGNRNNQVHKMFVGYLSID